jgi:hypothetical protein
VPAAGGPEGDVRITGQQRPARRAAAPADGPVVAAALVAGAGGHAEGLRGAPNWRIRSRRDDGLKAGFGSEEFSIQRVAAQRAFGEFGERDDKQPAGQIPAEFCQDGRGIQRRPRLGGVVEQGKLDRRPVAPLCDAGVDAGRKLLEEAARLGR